MINHYAPTCTPRPEPAPMHKCPEILEHLFYPAWLQLTIIVFESFFIGVIVGKII